MPQSVIIKGTERLRIFKNRAFHVWTESIGLPDDNLVVAVEEIMHGLCESRLGGHVYKKRIAVNDRGKSAGIRTILAYKTEKMAVFMYGFAKNKRDNVTKKELEALKLLGKIYFSYDDQQLRQAIHYGELIEVVKI
ncbi:MAG: type II toxin-antitoxin system RelE/ParE family toxin [Gammaproteobacteria bacterium]|nr:type II toxin-antitoxin system RelE/ParE family toxin [Gammaproteobacteria bacterium]